MNYLDALISAQTSAATPFIGCLDCKGVTTRKHAQKHGGRCKTCQAEFVESYGLSQQERLAGKAEGGGK